MIIKAIHKYAFKLFHELFYRRLGGNNDLSPEICLPTYERRPKIDGTEATLKYMLIDAIRRETHHLFMLFAPIASGAVVALALIWRFL